MLKRLLSLTGLLVLIVLIGAIVWFKANSRAVNSANDKVVFFEVSAGQSVDTIAKNLLNQNLIRSTLIFKLETKLRGLGQKIQAGEYELSQRYSLPETLLLLTHGRSDRKVTLLPGWRREQMAVALENTLGADGFSSTEFVKDTASLEGQLQPDTYLLPKSMTTSQVIDKLTSGYSEETKGVVNHSGLSDHDALVLASLVEREAGEDSEKALIAGVLLNRLHANWPLQVDATVQYVKASSKCKSLDCDWWTNDLTLTDLAMNSPYNTYKQTGLPPTPICNPAISTIKAAFNPQASDYWFYLHDTKGQIHFAKTLEEHNANVKKYLGK